MKEIRISHWTRQRATYFPRELESITQTIRAKVPVRKIMPSSAALIMAFEMKALTMGLRKILTNCLGDERQLAKDSALFFCLVLSLVLPQIEETAQSTKNITYEEHHLSHLCVVRFLIRSLTMRTMLVSTKKRVKVSYVTKMSPAHSLMMVWNNDMRTGLSKST
jgi:hypothetical protein